MPFSSVALRDSVNAPACFGGFAVAPFRRRELEALLGREFGADCSVCRRSSIGSPLGVVGLAVIELWCERAVVGIGGAFAEL